MKKCLRETKAFVLFETLVSFFVVSSIVLIFSTSMQVLYYLEKQQSETVRLLHRLDELVVSKTYGTFEHVVNYPKYMEIDNDGQKIQIYEQ